MRRLKPQNLKAADEPMRAIYAFSGDPITFGHIDIVQRAAHTYDELVVAIGENPEKSGHYLFSCEERLAMAGHALSHIPNVSCVTFNGLLGEYAYRHGFDVIVRGVRNASDLEGELVLFSVIESLHPVVDMVFFPARPELAHISSSIVKAVVREGGDASDYCPLHVKQRLEERLLQRTFVGVAGGIAAGKTYFAKRLVETLREQTDATYISLDEVGHYVLSTAEKAIYRNTRKRIARVFGNDVMHQDSSIDRRALGHIVFNEPLALKRLNQIMREPMLARLYEQTRDIPRGVVVLEGAILVEGHWTRIVNNNVILVDAPEDVRVKRLIDDRSATPDEARTKIARQPTAEDRKAAMQQCIDEARAGRIWEVNGGGDPIDYNAIAGDILKLSEPQ